MEMISKAIVDGSLEALSTKTESSRENVSLNRAQRRYLEKLKVKEESLRRRLASIDKKLEQRNAKTNSD